LLFNANSAIGVKQQSLTHVIFKNMKIRRIYDAESQTLMYLSYATKETSGSFKHSLSTVPLWGTQAYNNALQPAQK